ncbi:hypothetical protein F0562_012934 [Nyssa sinensis]|uniref:DOG1 domain-containing protein n=1 Tax=Nyssa sinensis TaxID=561372 RepID=A0A5J4ZYW3_9ASTE|nr:hypothetical protein F0562_012934 [Nyssa sinensis]
MLKAVSLFGRKKTSRPFKDYYAEWIETLENTLLPLLRRSMSLNSLSPNLLVTHVEMIHHHFQAYYDALDLAASDDVAQLLYPEWRNSLEKPFLWLGDFHPYLFTNLLRSFLDDDDADDCDIEIGECCELFNRPWHVVMAWKSPSKTLTTQIEQIECGLRLMVPALAARARNAQAGFVDRVAVHWARCEGRKEGVKAAIAEDLMAQIDEMMSVFVDANRLRRSVLAEIMAATNVYQGALFLEELAQFLVGFRDLELLGEFERCKVPVN